MDTVKKIKRIDIQLARVVSMLMIVFCHIVDEFYFIPGHNMLPQVFNVGVYTFFILSGYLYGAKNIERFAEWIFQRIRKVAIPAVVVSFTMFLMLKIFFDTQYDIETYIAYLFNIQGFVFLSGYNVFFESVECLGALWFITVILLCYVLTFFLQKLRSYIKSVNIFVLISVILIILRFILLYYLKIEIIYFIVYFIGYELSALKIKISNMKLSKFLSFSLVVFVIQLLRVVLQLTIDGTFFYSSYANVSHTFLGLWILVFCIWICKKYSKVADKISSLKIIQFFDEYSFYIYLTHFIFCADEFDKTNIFKSGYSFLMNVVLFIFATIVSSFVLKCITSGIDLLITKTSSFIISRKN